MGFAEIENFLWAGVIFLTFFITCCALPEQRYSQKNVIISAGVLLAGIVVLQSGLLLSGQDHTLVLTLLPLTAYLPVIIGVHIVSKSSFFQTSAVWTLGLLLSVTLSLFQKLLLRYSAAIPGLTFRQRSLMQTACLLLAAVLLLYIVLRRFRKPFQTYVLHNKTNWLLFCFPVLMIFLLLSYFRSSPTDGIVLILIFLTTLLVFLILARILIYSAREQQMQEAEKAVTAQLEIQRQEYEEICEKIAAGRAYRHDMRHHLSVLEELADKGSQQEMKNYISSINGQLQEAEQKSFCENMTVNAVLSSYIRKAEHAGCSVSADINIPDEIPFDPLDICSILANALENAANACTQNIQEENRHLSIFVRFEDNQKLVISIENPCETPVSIGKSGFPDVPCEDGHGIGLKSIENISRKYNGLFSCEFADGIFSLNVILFVPNPAVPPKTGKKKHDKAAVAAMTALLVFCVTINCMPVMAQEWENIPLLGTLIRVVNLKTYEYRWGGTSFQAVQPLVDFTNSTAGGIISFDKPADTVSALTTTQDSGSIQAEVTDPSETGNSSKISVSQAKPGSSGTFSWEDGTEPTVPSVTLVPEELPPSKAPYEESSKEPSKEHSAESSGETGNLPPALSEGVDEINSQMEDYIKELRDKFLWYVARKYNGYVALDCTHTILRNDELLVIRFDTTINAGGSGQYSRSFVLDKITGKALELSDLFQSGSDYISVISEEVKQQMAQRENSYDYFIPGGIWGDEELFQEIAPDQNFYINDQNQLVIVFDEYEVASGRAGMPEFVIPAEILSHMLEPASFLE